MVLILEVFAGFLGLNISIKVQTGGPRLEGPTDLKLIGLNVSFKDFSFLLVSLSGF